MTNEKNKDEVKGLFGRKKAEGTFEWGGLIGAVLIIDLTFPNGKKLHFSGRFGGEVIGTASGVCSYNGQVIPKPGDKWKFEVGAGDPGVGGAYVFFNPVKGPHARVLAVTAGGGAIPVAGGKGTWSKG